MVLAGVSSGCDGFTLFVSPVRCPIPIDLPTAPPPPRPIVLGDVVHGTFIVPETCFDLQAPKWDAVHPDHVDRRHGDLDLAFLSSVFSTTSHDASVTGTLHVAQGQRYRISVVGNPGPIPFTLATSLESP